MATETSSTSGTDVTAPTDYAATYNITKEFLENVLQTSEKNSNITVRDFEVTSATEKGDNFASVILSCKVTAEQSGTEVKHDLIIKTIFNSPVVKKMLLEDSPVFAKEAYMYREVIPAMISYQTSRDVEPIIPSFPKFYYESVTKDHGVIVMSDLRPENYRMIDKRKGLDLHHCRLAMKELARWHSLTYAIKDKGTGEIKRRFDDVLFYEMFLSGDPVTASWINTSVKMAADIIVACDTTDQIKELAKSLKEIDVIDELRGLLKPEEPFAVICHGDFWCNNMLFKYAEDGETPIGLKMLDFQISRYAPAATDLAYLIFTSTTASLRRNHLNELLELYHSTFVDCLNHMKLSFPEFTLDALREQYDKMKMFGLLFACIILPTILSDSEHIQDSEDIKSQEDMDAMMDDLPETILKMASNNNVRERLVGVFEDFVGSGH